MSLGERDHRFAELHREMGAVSKRMLSLTLRRLERDGVVTRTVFDTVPPAVSYGLTPLGQSLRGAVEALGHWAVDNHGAIEEARKCFDAKSASSTSAVVSAGDVHRLGRDKAVR